MNPKQQKLYNDLVEIATKHGGSVLSDRYIDQGTKMDFFCGNSEHPIYNATPKGVKQQGSWCIHCATDERSARTRDDIEELRQAAIKHGGRLLSEDIRIHINSACGNVPGQIYILPLRWHGEELRRVVGVKSVISWRCH